MEKFSLTSVGRLWLNVASVLEFIFKHYPRLMSGESSYTMSKWMYLKNNKRKSHSLFFFSSPFLRSFPLGNILFLNKKKCMSRKRNWSGKDISITRKKRLPIEKNLIGYWPKMKELSSLLTIHWMHSTYAHVRLSFQTSLSSDLSRWWRRTEVLM